jgi:hypothetical protein
MCTGVTRGLAGIKFSGSPNVQGKKKQIIISSIIIIKNPNKSFDEKYG